MTHELIEGRDWSLLDSPPTPPPVVPGPILFSGRTVTRPVTSIHVDRVSVTDEAGQGESCQK